MHIYLPSAPVTQFPVPFGPPSSSHYLTFISLHVFIGLAAQNSVTFPRNKGKCASTGEMRHYLCSFKTVKNIHGRVFFF
jgi:hypothetical protein